MVDLAAYILTNDEDTDILINPVRSLVGVVDSILLCDVGNTVGLYNNRRPDTQTVREFVDYWKRYEGWPLEYTDATLREDDLFYDWARNKADELLQNREWVMFLDSDEMLSNEGRQSIQEVLQTLNEREPGVSTIRPKWLTPWPDMLHYSINYSGTLSHGRIYRPKMISWHNKYHEHQDFKGSALNWDVRILHFRQLWQNRCERQRGHRGDAWSGISDAVGLMSELPVTWGEIVHADEDPQDV